MVPLHVLTFACEDTHTRSRDWVLLSSLLFLSSARLVSKPCVFVLALYGHTFATYVAGIV